VNGTIEGRNMNRVLLGYVSLLTLISSCTSLATLSTHDTGHKIQPVESGAHEELQKFNIAAGDAPTALNEFSIQANKQVLFDYAVLRDRQTRGVEGMLQPSEALRSMLKDTGLVADNVNEQTFAIMPDRSPRKPQRLPN
jgi:hypothetical protein